MMKVPTSSASGGIARVAIVGGGTSGWMAAAALARIVPRDVAVTLIESADIGVIGVGEATIPTLADFNAFIRLDENEMLRHSQGTFKLGIEFVGWGAAGERYYHPFGSYGRDTPEFPFHQLWLRLREIEGDAAGTLADYNLCSIAARNGRFVPGRGGPDSILGSMRHAYHFDSILYGRLLRERAEKMGVTRIEATVTDVERDGQGGNILAVTLADGRRVEADLWIDCTGFAARLAGAAMGSEFIDWSHWLPCDRALAMPCARDHDPEPYTRATADAAGWRWRIPLQHRIGNGHVYASAFMEEAEAHRRLIGALEGEPTADARPIAFRTGHRRDFWIGNCVAIGLAGGFVEPLESTSIHLVQTGLQRLIALWPAGGDAAAERREYNRAMAAEYERLRDFIILHYKATRRDDTPFWRHCRDMAVPDTLTQRIELFAASGRLVEDPTDLFTPHSWIAVLTGQGIRPRDRDRLVDRLPADALVENMRKLREAIAGTAARMPTHQHYIDQHCVAPRHDQASRAAVA